ncbi:hypothetical protein C0030_002890 [Candidatus Liberibacter solanacearum]|uniref:Uncharacterized protein n=1 Tax=Candidatus Liberibacter solanacearum TaxID=556287 RepID=A0A424FME6_9HYPH|nr:hypothetical protein [Candidatus Liberibacter solanacearum]RPD37326.1 hypothetical protein C0030_002890 [Candidatus Liberibacter solanacearum]
MAKKQEQAITRQEFNSLSSGHKALSIKVDHIDDQFKASEARDEKQQQGIEEILSILQGLKWFFASIKNIAIIVTSLTAIIYGVFNIKAWLKQ